MRLKNVLGALLLVVSLSLFTGCKTNQQMAPGGPYSGRADLYNVDNVLISSYDLIHTFVQWELDNRAVLPVEISRIADAIRDRAKPAFQSAKRIRDAYRDNPTTDNKNALDTAIAVIRQITTEAVNFMASNGGPKLQTNSPPRPLDLLAEVPSPSHGVNSVGHRWWVEVE